MDSDEEKRFMGRTSINVLTNTLRTVLMALIGLLLVPYYLENLGTAAYGIIPLATTMTSYVMILCDSLTYSSSRYSVLALHKGDDEQSNIAINTAFFGVLRVCILLIPVVLILSYVSPYVFSVPDDMDMEVQILFLGVLASSLIVAVASSLECVLQARNKLYIVYIIRMAYAVIQLLMIVLMFNTSTPSLAQVGMSYIVSSAILFVLLYIAAKRNYRGLRIRRRYFSTKTFKEMGTLGLWSIIEKLGGMLYIQISLVLVNLYLGAEEEAGFAIVSSMISMIHTACFSLTAAIPPLIYKCYAEEDIKGLLEMSISGIKVTLLILAFPVAMVIVFAPQILTTWVGVQHEGLADLVRIAFLSDMLYCSSTVIDGIPMAYGKLRSIAIVTIGAGLMNTVGALMVLWYTDYGMEGVMWVWVVAVAVRAMYMFLFTEYLMKVKYRNFLWPLIYGHLVMAVSVGLLFILADLVDVEPTWIYIIPFFIILFLIYLIPMYNLLLNARDRSIVLSMLPRTITDRMPVFMKR